MIKHIGMWTRIAIVVSIAWIVIGSWWYHHALTGEVIRFWHEAVLQCKGRVDDLKCTDAARSVFDGQLSDTWFYAVSTAFVRLLVVWLIAAIAIYAVKWIKAGRKESLPSVPPA